MSEIICRSISNGREFEVPNDYFRSLHALRIECNSYTEAELRYNELIAEHDRQIREEVISEIITLCDDYRASGHNLDVEKYLREQLKEQKNDD